MSLVGIMHLLGHRSLKMTLCYAAVTQETVREEYFSALEKLENRYRLTSNRVDPALELSPTEHISAVIRWLKKDSVEESNRNKRQTSLLLKRMHRIVGELEALTSK
jgi:hypothetical protein